MLRAGANWAILAAVAVTWTLGCIEPAPGAGGKQREAGGRETRRRETSAYLQPAARPAHPAHAVFGNAIELVGWDLEPPAPAPGEWVTLTLYWRALDELDTSWRVFVHLDGREGQERIHGDHPPAAGTYPTDRWHRGDVVRDPVRIRVPRGYRGEALDAWVGWFSGETRLRITNPGEVRQDGDDRLLLAVVSLARR